MSAFFGALSTLFRKLETFTNYFVEKVSASYESFGQAQRVGLLIFIIFVLLFAWYFFVLILRFSFKRRTRKLKNVRREYQITLNRAIGKRCNFLWDIILFQKMVILDDPVMPKEMLAENVYLPFQEAQKRVTTSAQEQPVPEEAPVEEVIVLDPKPEPKPEPEPRPEPEPVVVEEVVNEEPVVEEVKKPEPVVEEVIEETPEVVEVVNEPEPTPQPEPKPEPEPEPEVAQPAPKAPKVEEPKRTKKDLIEYMLEHTDLNKSKANRFLKYFAEVVTEALRESDSIKLEEFGTFLVLDIEESTRYIPSKDEMRILPAHKEVRYRAAKELKDLLNKEE